MLSRRRLRCYQSEMDLSSSAAGSRCGTGGCCRTGLEAPLGGALRCRQRLFDGKIQLSVLDGKELYLNVLPLLQKVMYIVDIAVGDLRNMYQAGLAALQAPNFVILVTLPSKTVPTSYSISAVLLLFLFLLK